MRSTGAQRRLCEAIGRGGDPGQANRAYIIEISALAFSKPGLLERASSGRLVPRGDVGSNGSPDDRCRI